MFYVYVLKSCVSTRLYVGYTANLKVRMKQHQNKKVWTTARMGEVELIFYEAFKSKPDALRREKYLKTSKGKSSIKQILRLSLE